MRSKAKLALCILSILLLLMIAAVVLKAGFALLSPVTREQSEPDPQFAAEPDATATIPPQLTDEGSGALHEDHSSSWDTSVQTPVDQTADELIAQAQDAA